MTEDCSTIELQIMSAIDSLCDVGFSAGGFDVLVTGYGNDHMVDLRNSNGDSISIPATPFLNILRSLKGELGENRLSPLDLWGKIDSYQP